MSKLVHRNYLKNQYIVQQGDTCKSANFIISGCTKTYYIDLEGQEHILMFSIEDWWTSDLGSFITQTPGDFNVQCLENTQLIQFTHDNLEELYKQIPKLERLFRKIVERAFVASQKRIIRNFSLTAKERYLIFKKTYPKASTKVITLNYRSAQDILDCAYRLIQFNNPDRLEAREKLDKEEQLLLCSALDFVAANQHAAPLQIEMLATASQRLRSGN